MWCIIAMGLGYVLGKVYPTPSLHAVIPLALLLMLFPAMLQVDFPQILAIFVSPALLVSSLVLNFLVSPLLMFVILHLLPSPDAPFLTVGMILYASVPCGGLVPAYTKMLNGNVGLAVMIATTSLVMSLGIVPFWITALIGNMIPVPALLAFKYLACIIVIPLLMAVSTRWIVVRTRGEWGYLVVRDRMKLVSDCGLILFLLGMSWLHGDRVLDQPWLVLRIATLVLVFMTGLFALCGALGLFLRFRCEDLVALKVSTAAKNNVIALALAYSAFGAETALVNVICGPLVQLPLLLGYIAIRQSRRLA